MKLYNVNVKWYSQTTIVYKLDVRGSVHHSTILTEKKTNKMQQCIKIWLFLILNEAQHVSDDTPPIIRSLKLHKQPLDLHTWKVVGHAVVGRCQVAYALLFLILSEAQHVLSDTPSIIRSLKLHKQPLDLHTWKVVGHAVVRRCQVAYALLFLILNEAQHVLSDTPSIIRSLKLHKQPLDLHTWKVVGHAVFGRCQVAYALLFLILNEAQHVWSTHRPSSGA